jgi:hypothetical protein
VTERSELGSVSIQETDTRYNAGLTSVGTETTEVCATGDELFYVEKIHMNANENHTMRHEL